MMEEQPGYRSTAWQKFVNVFMDNLLTILLVIGVALGCGMGMAIRLNMPPLSDRNHTYLGFPGSLLIRMLKCSATPLIMSCIIVALGSLDLTVSKTLSWQLLIYVFATKIIAATLGVIMAIICVPGKGGGKIWDKAESAISSQGKLEDIFFDIFRNILSQNMMLVFVQQRQTKLIVPRNETSDLRMWDIDVAMVDSMNLLGMVVIAATVGLGITILQQEGRGLLIVVKDIYQVSMKVATWVLWTAPVCLFFLIMAEILHISDFKTYFTIWGFYILVLNASFLIMILIVHPLILYLFTRTNILKFYIDICTVLITAWVTASSMASLPLLVDGLLQNGVDSRIVRFLVPTGVNVNKDGSAIFQALACVFVAQMTAVDLSFGHYISIVFLASLGSMASAAVPFGAAIVLNMMLGGLGLDQSLIGGIIAVEWINDRGQTLVNISGNSIHPKVLEKLNQKLLNENNLEGNEDNQRKNA